MKQNLLPFCFFIALTTGLSAQNQPPPAGIFEASADVGPVLHAGKTEYDSAGQSYKLSGSGANIWFRKDEFHYAYKRLKGNFILQTRARGFKNRLHNILNKQ